MLLSGIFAPITTPFYPDGRVYFRKLEHNVDRYSRTPLAGMVVLGSTGEPVMLSSAEQREVLAEAITLAAPEKVMIAGCGAESVVETLRLIEHAAAHKYDAAMVRTPHFYKSQMTPLVMLNFYRTVADRSPLPVILYTVPAFTGYDLPVEVVAELAQHPNIMGIKDSSGNVEKAAQMVEATREVKRSANVTEVFAAVTGRMLAPKNDTAGVVQPGLIQLGAAPAASGNSATAVAAFAAAAAPPKLDFKMRTKEVGFQVLVGAAHTLKASLEAGAVGAILGFACGSPTACFEIFTATREGDDALAEEKQKIVGEAAKYVVNQRGVAGVKYAMDLNGYYGGSPRLPLLPLTAAQKDEVARLVATLRN